jgi:hypothetical protein
MRRVIRCVSALLLLALAAPAVAAPPGLPEAWGQRPLAFEENRGQTDPNVLFLARASDHEFFLTATEAVLVPLAGEGALHLRWVDADPAPRVRTEGKLSGQSSYYLGNEPARWQTAVPLWSKVRLERLWPGIDLVFYGNPRELEHDFVVAPGADPGKIGLALDGAGRARIDDSGDLVVQLEEGGEVRLRKPAAYQETGKTRREVPCRFQLLPGNRLTFALETWDRARPLIIDPVVVWSTFLGGSDADDIRAVAVDPAGNLWVTGETRSFDFPVQGSTPPSELPVDAFVAKLSPAGALLFSTYLGGRSSVDFGYAVAVDASGNAWVGGQTDSPDFPLVHPVPAEFQGDGAEIFVAKFAPDGQILSSSHMGGVQDMEFAEGIAVGPDGSPWIVGHTFSPDFPIFRPIEPFDYDTPFVIKLSPDGAEVLLSTTLGTPLDGEGFVSAVTVDAAGRAWLAANRWVEDAGNDVLVTEIDPTGSSIVWSTTFGGQGDDYATAIALAADGSLWVTGTTGSPDFPVRGLQPASPRGASDVFATRLRPDSRRLVYSAVFGGSGADAARGVAVDGTGRVYLAGWTTSADSPLRSPLQDHCAPVGADGRCVADAFLLQMTPADGIVWSTYWGGAAVDDAFGITVDRRGNVYAGGRTSSTGFPAANAFQPTFGGGESDGFVMRIRR